MSNVPKNKIVDYWFYNSNICETELNFDWADALKVCWNCGSETSRIERCHIIPKMLGGEDIPSNLVLLCNDCHLEAPDINDKDSMWNWIKSNRTKSGLYGSYKIEKAFAEFEKRNGYSFLSKAVLIENFTEIFKKEITNIGLHSGKIKISSIVFLFEKIIKEYIQKL